MVRRLISRALRMVSPTIDPSQRRASVEALERRQLFATAPYVSHIIADNRGEIEVTIAGALLNASTVNRRSVMMHTAGADGIIGNADDKKEYARVWWNPGNRRIRIRAKLPANTLYRIKLNSKLITSVDGLRLDGEFNGNGVRSGDGVAGGDSVFVSKPDKSTRPVARFNTSEGTMNVRIYKDLTPQTVANFMYYANHGSWDGTFFHRSVPTFVIQGGGFVVTKDNTIGSAHQIESVINEPVVSNTRGRISMAKIGGQPNSATNQWFFNVTDNAELDSSNGGFTAFGEITNESGLATMDRVNGLDRVNAGGAFSELPVRDRDEVVARGFLSPKDDVIMIRRVAMINKVVALQPV